MRPEIRTVSRRARALLLVALFMFGAMPRLAAASGGGEPPSMPPSAPPSAPPEQPVSPEEKAANDRKTAEGLYADGYKECDKAKAEMAQAESLAALTDPKAAEKAKKLSDSAQKRLTKQIDKFQTATTLDPKYYEAWNMLGFCLRKTGDSQKAMQAYWECLRIKSDYAPAHEYLGEAYVEAGNIEKAHQELAWLRGKDQTLAFQLQKKIAQYEQAHPTPAAPADSTGTRTATGSGSGSN